MIMCFDIEADAPLEIREAMRQKIDECIEEHLFSSTGCCDTGVCSYESDKSYTFYDTFNVLMEFSKKHPDITILVTTDDDDGDKERLLFRDGRFEHLYEIRTWEQPTRIPWKGSELW